MLELLPELLLEPELELPELLPEPELELPELELELLEVPVELDLEDELYLVLLDCVVTSDEFEVGE